MYKKVGGGGEMFLLVSENKTTWAVSSSTKAYNPFISSGRATNSPISPDAGATNVLQVSKTDEKGQYVFFGVLPGRYFLRIGQEDKSKYDFETIQHEVDVGEDVGNSKPFQIQGYRIKGSISDFTNRTD